MCGNYLQQTISLFSVSISKMKEEFILTSCFSLKMISEYLKAIFKIISQQHVIIDWWSMLCENTRKSTYFIKREKFCYYGSFCNMLGVIQFNKSAANKTGNFSATAKHEFYEYLNTTTFCIGETFIRCKAGSKFAFWQRNFWSQYFTKLQENSLCEHKDEDNMG